MKKQKKVFLVERVRPELAVGYTTAAIDPYNLGYALSKLAVGERVTVRVVAAE